jgi:pimeloyl-ACP methyl ester carboxylesterase
MRMTRPAVHYATTADGLEIAYQVLGDGPLDVVIVPGLSSNLDWNAELPFYGGYLRRFPRFARTIVLDRRGGGVSDREVGSGSAEDRMDDVRAVMDAVGCQRAALLGQVEGGAIAILFAATYPKRASALVLVETSARRSSAPDYPEGILGEWFDVAVSHNRAHWGSGRALFPLLDAHDARAATEVARFRGRIVKQTGDGHLAVFDGPARAIRCAHAMLVVARGLGVELRAGLHTGEIEQRGEDVSGLAVHIGARIVALAPPGEVLVSSTVRDLVVGSGLEFDDRGDHELRGVAGTWRLLVALRP